MGDMKLVLRKWLLALGGTALLWGVGEARAYGWELIDGEGFGLELGGYAQSAGGLVRPGVDWPDESIPEYGGLHGQVFRLQWRAHLGESLMVELDQRLLAQMTSGAALQSGEGYGLGASVTPERSVDWEWRWVDEEGVGLSHDVERLILRYFASWGEVVVGRQAITWGSSALFPVVDVWAQFSPLELDQTEKPGVDAVRALLYPGGGIELDVVVADRGGWDDIAYGLRASRSFGAADIVVGGGRFWRRGALLLGAAYDFSSWKGRADVYVPLAEFESEAVGPRATLGVDILRGRWLFSVEQHFNGGGASDARGYQMPARQDALSRGETYYSGRHYTGGVLSVEGQGRFRGTVSAQVNWSDGSVLVGPSVYYALSDASDLTVGFFEGIGDRAVLVPQPELRSEFGAYGGFYYAQFRGFF
ncbi:hypothetical protein DL240_08295 [Lujinxingia litoralis]|uniref:Porin domain-containing protein n=1 Tax=Lujinxingia litoralis TaxID=2211119 RepID=A0A328CAU4_9DELT|nr:hypothetical protein [Lujinxingia litoralis]RAL22883.1 hypothetical protein DL240_08295 [Lujinxingia litoralis]